MATNTNAETALDISLASPGCSFISWSTSGYPTSPPGTDYIATLESFNSYHQAWFTFTNPSSNILYARFTFEATPSTEIVAYGFLGSPPSLQSIDSLYFRSSGQIGKTASTGPFDQVFFDSTATGTESSSGVGFLLRPGEVFYLGVGVWPSGASTAITMNYKLLDVPLAADTTSYFLPPPYDATPLEPHSDTSYVGSSYLATTDSALESVFVSAYTHGSGKHFLAHVNQISGTYAEYPSTDFPLYVHVINDDGTLDGIYTVDTDYSWSGWTSHFTGLYRGYLNEDDIFNTQIRIGSGGGWAKSIPTDGVKLVSDGTNVWLGIVMQQDRVDQWCTSDIASQVVDDAYSYINTTIREYVPNTLGGHRGPYSSGGRDITGHHSPYVLLMFIWNGAGFTRIGTVENKYLNDVGMGSTSGITTLAGSSPDGALVTGPNLSASPNEPGVCHALWGEGGIWYYHQYKRGTRTVYSKWNTGGKISETEILVEESFDVDRDDGAVIGDPSDAPVWNPPNWIYREITSGSLAGEFSGFGPPFTSSNFAWTPNIRVANDGGSPVMFLSKILLKSVVSSGSTIYGLDQSEFAVRFWDLGSVTELQTLGSSLLPTLAETGSIFTPSRVTTGTMASNFGISNVMNDSTLSNTPVYLIVVNFCEGDNTSHRISVMYRIPADGSATFDNVDGRRDYALCPTSGGNTMDFFNEPRNIWMPNVSSTPSAWHQLDRICQEAWISAPATYPNSPNVAWRFVSFRGKMGPYFSNDRLYYPAFDSVGGPTHSGVGQSVILRNFVICSVPTCNAASILHIWQRIS